MAEGGGDGGGTVTALSPSDVIENLIKEVNELVEEANDLAGNNSMSSSYRCATCTKLSHEHPKGDVKGCRQKPLTTENYIQDLINQ